MPPKNVWSCVVLRHFLSKNQIKAAHWESMGISEAMKEMTLMFLVLLVEFSTATSRHFMYNHPTTNSYSTGQKTNKKHALPPKRPKNIASPKLRQQSRASMLPPRQEGVLDVIWRVPNRPFPWTDLSLERSVSHHLSPKCSLFNQVSGGPLARDLLDLKLMCIDRISITRRQSL